MRSALLLATLLLTAPAFAQEGAKVQKTEFLEVKVLDAIPLDTGWAVLLKRDGDDTILPIFIGDAEGMAIRLRLARQKPPRPLTHDLLQNVVTALGAKIVKVEVDDLRGDTFLGRIYLEQGKKKLDIDARPSDSIALALGAGAPIHVSKRVMEKAGLKKKDLMKKRRGAKPEEDTSKTESL